MVLDNRGVAKQAVQRLLDGRAQAASDGIRALKVNATCKRQDVSQHQSAGQSCYNSSSDEHIIRRTHVDDIELPWLQLGLRKSYQAAQVIESLLKLSISTSQATILVFSGLLKAWLKIEWLHS
jgi:hypothetical protein